MPSSASTASAAVELEATARTAWWRGSGRTSLCPICSSPSRSASGVLKLLPDIANECGAIASGGRILLVSIVTSAIAQSQVLMIFPRRRPVSLAHRPRADGARRADDARRPVVGGAGVGYCEEERAMKPSPKPTWLAMAMRLQGRGHGDAGVSQSRDLEAGFDGVDPDSEVVAVGEDWRPLLVSEALAKRLRRFVLIVRRKMAVMAQDHLLAHADEIRHLPRR
jgi:hypothetical protein